MKNYIIGYGSLINFESQNITAQSSWSKPIWLNHHSRHWNVNFDELQFCALGVTPNRGQRINAVIFCTEGLDQFDQREFGYTRQQLDPHLIEMWNSDDSVPIDGSIWIYYPKTEQVGVPSNEKHFIWQSYLDVILMGCLSIEQKFAEIFIQTTLLWNQDIIRNDRENSVYVRRLQSYDQNSIDHILEKMKEN